MTLIFLIFRAKLPEQMRGIQSALGIPADLQLNSAELFANG